MARKRKSDTRPRIYVADVGAYAAGRLHGAWIDAAQDPEEIRSEIEEMLTASPVPGGQEIAIHDSEGFGKINIDEFLDIDAVANIAKLIEERGDVFAAVLDHFGGPRYLEEAIEAMDEHYQGAYDSLEDWAHEFAKDSGTADSEHYSRYIDWSAVGRDAELGGDVFTVETGDGKVHVFWSR